MIIDNEHLPFCYRIEVKNGIEINTSNQTMELTPSWVITNPNCMTAFKPNLIVSREISIHDEIGLQKIRLELKKALPGAVPVPAISTGVQ